MKKLIYILTALVCATFTACMDGGYDDTWTSEAPYGNNNISETNLVSIAQLKNMYSKVLKTDYRSGVSYQKVDQDLQIKGFVTANDITGNIYNELWIQDETGAICVAVQQGGMCGYLPVGAEIIVELNGLYVGNYRKQAEIGVPYTNNRDQTYVSRMSRMEWMSHFKITGNKKVIEPEVFAVGNAATTWNLDNDAGKLGTLKNVSFKNGSYYDSSAGKSVTLKFNDKAVYDDPEAGFSTSWYFNEQKTTVMLYTSPYCDFANKPLPHGKVDITGILKRYDSSWEIIVRSLDDVKPAQ